MPTSMVDKSPSSIKKKYHDKTLSDDAIYLNWLRLLDTESEFAEKVWMQISVFDLSELGLGLLYSILPTDYKPYSIDFTYEMPSLEELEQGIWVNFEPVSFDRLYTWMTDFRAYIIENFKEEFQPDLLIGKPEKAVYGVTPYARGVYDPAIAREFLRATFHKLRLIRTPDQNWKTMMDQLADYLDMIGVTDEHVFNRIMLLYSAQTNAFVLGLSVLGRCRFSEREGDFAKIPFMDAQGNICEVKFRTLDHLQLGWILGVTPLGYGLLLPKESIYNLPDGKKNPPIIKVMAEKIKGIIDRTTMTAWAYSNYNKPEEMRDHHKSEKTNQYDLLQSQRRFVENWVYNSIPSNESNAVRIRQYQTAVLQAICWRSKRHCYDQDTEILTEDGWKRYDELKIGENVATLNKNGVMEYQPILGIYIYPYDGRMYNIKNNVVDLMVTPEHKLYVALNYWSNSPHFELIEAGKVVGRGTRFKRNGTWVVSNYSEYFILPKVENPTHPHLEKKIPMKEWLKFLGLWLAEGSITLSSRDKHEYIISIANQNKELLDEMIALLHSWDFKTFRTGKNGLQIYNKQLYNYLVQFGKSNQKFIPKEVKNLPSEYLKILFEYMMRGDGYRGNGGDGYYTTSKRLADDLQEILLKIGLSGNMRISKICRSGKPLYEVSILKPEHNHPRFWGNRDKKNHEKMVDYEGIVWCVMTKNGIVYVRRNGTPAWCGNSWGFDAWKTMTEDQFKDWWLTYWASQGLSTQTLNSLYSGMSLWLKHLRDEKQRLGQKIQSSRKRLALSV